MATEEAFARVRALDAWTQLRAGRSDALRADIGRVQRMHEKADDAALVGALVGVHLEYRAATARGVDVAPCDRWSARVRRVHTTRAPGPTAMQHAAYDLQRRAPVAAALPGWAAMVREVLAPEAARGILYAAHPGRQLAFEAEAAAQEAIASAVLSGTPPSMFGGQHNDVAEMMRVIDERLRKEWRTLRNELSGHALVLAMQQRAADVLSSYARSALASMDSLRRAALHAAAHAARGATAVHGGSPWLATLRTVRAPEPFDVQLKPADEPAPGDANRARSTDAWSVKKVLNFFVPWNPDIMVLYFVQNMIRTTYVGRLHTDGLLASYSIDVMTTAIYGLLWLYTWVPAEPSTEISASRARALVARYWNRAGDLMLVGTLYSLSLETNEFDSTRMFFMSVVLRVLLVACRMACVYRTIRPMELKAWGAYAKKCLLTGWKQRWEVLYNFDEAAQHGGLLVNLLNAAKKFVSVEMVNFFALYKQLMPGMAGEFESFWNGQKGVNGKEYPSKTQYNTELETWTYINEVFKNEPMEWIRNELKIHLRTLYRDHVEPMRWWEYVIPLTSVVSSALWIVALVWRGMWIGALIGTLMLLDFATRTQQNWPVFKATLVFLFWIVTAFMSSRYSPPFVPVISTLSEAAAFAGLADMSDLTGNQVYTIGMFIFTLGIGLLRPLSYLGLMRPTSPLRIVTYAFSLILSTFFRHHVRSFKMLAYTPLFGAILIAMFASTWSPLAIISGIVSFIYGIFKYTMEHVGSWMDLRDGGNDIFLNIVEVYKDHGSIINHWWKTIPTWTRVPKNVLLYLDQVVVADPTDFQPDEKTKDIDEHEFFWKHMRAASILFMDDWDVKNHVDASLVFRNDGRNKFPKERIKFRYNLLKTDDMTIYPNYAEFWEGDIWYNVARNTNDGLRSEHYESRRNELAQKLPFIRHLKRPMELFVFIDLFLSSSEKDGASELKKAYPPFTKNAAGVFPAMMIAVLLGAKPFEHLKDVVFLMLHSDKKITLSEEVKAPSADGSGIVRPDQLQGITQTDGSNSGDSGVGRSGVQPLVRRNSSPLLTYKGGGDLVTGDNEDFEKDRRNVKKRAGKPRSSRRRRI